MKPLISAALRFMGAKAISALPPQPVAVAAEPAPQP
jgi:hypothetical protein